MISAEHRQVILTVMLVVIVCPLAAGAPVNNAHVQAKTILDISGITGGLAVHLGCNDGALTQALGVRQGFIVHGLDTNVADVSTARSRISANGIYGSVSVDLLRGARLPYADNIVNLLVTEDLGEVSMEEVTRVLAPNGVACIKKNGTWNKKVKPRPESIDEWTHFLHGPDNNAVAHDEVIGPPSHIQWVGAPKWARHHNYMSSTSAMVSTGGRVFAIIDVGPVFSLNRLPEWTLVARDAFSGVLLWERQIGDWEGHLRRFRSGPTELQRRLVAVDDTVYVTLAYGEPVTALDAATGKTVRTYAGTEGALEIVVSDGVMYTVIGDMDEKAYAQSLRERGPSPTPVNKRIRAVRTDTGTLLWEKTGTYTQSLMPTTLCVADGTVFFQNPAGISSLDAATGRQNWFADRPVATSRFSWSSPTMIVKEGVVLSADRQSPSAAMNLASMPSKLEYNVSPKGLKTDAAIGELVAFSADDGRKLWSGTAAIGYNSPPDLFVADGLVWVNEVRGTNDVTFTEGRDLRTGEVKRRLNTAAAFTETHHHRCYRNKATDKYIVLGRTGIEFISLNDDAPVRNCWVRGACQYGVMPCNGLLYLPPHSCACYIQSKLTGFYALAPASVSRTVSDDVTARARIERGTAYGSVKEPGTNDPDDWPTYRHDTSRSGRTDIRMSADLSRRWRTPLGGTLTAPVAANGTVCVASVDTHTVHAIRAVDGKRMWSFKAGGRVDSPPTIHGDMVLFGSADGRVYCLRRSDGTLVWRSLVAPVDTRVVSFDQIESVWPVTGSVLVHDGVVYCTAGRSSYLDGGMWLCRLDPATGKSIGRTNLDFRDPATGGQPEERMRDVELPGALPDVLAYDGDSLYLRDLRMDLDGTERDPDVPHMYSPVGFLDDNWWHRTYWIFGTQVFGRASGWAVVASHVPSGRMLATDGSSIYGYGRKSVRNLGLSDVPMRLFKADREVIPLDRLAKRNNNKALIERLKPSRVKYFWSREIPVVVRGMAVTQEKLFVAGPVMNEKTVDAEPLFTAGEAASLAVVAAVDGKTLAQYRLDVQPVFDGLIAAKDSIYISTLKGTIERWSGE